MADSKLNVLIVEDDPQLLRILQAVLKQEVELRTAGTGRLALQMIEELPPSIVLLDMRLPDMTGMDILKDLSRRAQPATVIVMTAHGSVDLAVDAMREGAYDFLTKPLDFERVRVMVRNAIERHRIILELDSYKTQYERTRFRGLLGSSPAMQRLYRQIRSLGQGASPVLFLGEPGTELDACARALHDESARAEKTFLQRDAGQITPAELSAVLNECNGGTLHLRNIGGISSDASTHLLEYLNSGSLTSEPIDARVVASTQKALEETEFDKQLLMALSVARVTIAPLRERGEDVLDLAEHLLGLLAKEVGRSFAELSDEVEVAFVNYTWPGNRDELETTLRTAVQQHEGRVLTDEMLPPAIAELARKGRQDAGTPLRGLAAAGTIRPLWQVEREEIEKAIKLCDGNVLQAARLLEVSPGTIYRKQQSWKSKAS